MSYLVVTHLDLRDADRIPVERELSALGLLNCLVDSRNQPHVLPRGTYAGVFEAPTARALRQQIAGAVRAAVGRTSPEARVFVSIGGDWSLRHAA